MPDIISSTIEELIIETPSIAKEVVDRQYELQPKFNSYGAKGRLKSIEDAKYNIQYLLSAIESDSIKLFEQYIKWAKELFKSQNMPTNTIEVFYSCTKDILKYRFDKGLIKKELYDKILQYIEDGIAVAEEDITETEVYSLNENPYRETLEKYSNFVLDGDKRLAVKLIMELVNNGDIDIKDIYKYILQPFQTQLGVLWHKNKISVGQEHYATAVSQYTMSLLYDRIFSTPKNNKVFLGTCVEGELHELGIRMICDYIESCGWNTYYLGANMPDRDIIRTINEKKPDVIGISCTMVFNVQKVKNLIEEIKENGINTPIIVGGYPFNIDENLWQNIRADGHSKNFDEAKILIERLYGEKHDEI